MERFYTYWKKHFQPEQAAWEYLQEHARVRSYATGSYFMLAKDVQPYWCFVLNGLVAALELLPGNKAAYAWVVDANRYFTGTRHLFTTHAPDFHIQFLRPTQLLLIPVAVMRQAQQHFMSVSELLHVLKQQRIKRQETMLLLALANTVQRYALFRTLLPDLYAQLNEHQQIAFLHMSRSQFYRAKAAWNR
ncbi:Crp/Fnr family transcriptional regulator [Parapedobacter sp. DT-150]|uniref:Crp/Fnr family transcriptional regulator n=1 Tax=Parapedobacter sp. DT-150 TaxID=3396162 RepID=UPI003F193FE0